MGAAVVPQPFRDMLAHPKVIPYLNTLLGRSWKLDQGVDLLSPVEGCEGRVPTEIV